MLRRIFGIALVLIGAAVLAVAWASGTVWKPDREVAPDATARSVHTYVITAPGTLEDFSDELTITATAPGATVVGIIGAERDVLGWIGEDDVQVVTGLEGWESLILSDVEDTFEPVPPPTATPETTEEPDATDEPDATEDPDGTEAPDATESPEGDELLPGENPDEAAIDPRGSDMWFEEFTGTDELELPAPVLKDNQVLLIAAVGEPDEPLTIVYTWERQVTVPYMVLGMVVGGILILLGLLGLVVAAVKSRRKKRLEAAEEAIRLTTGGIPIVTPELLAQAGDSPFGDGDTQEPAAESGAIAAVTDTGRVLTRRELRELREQIQRKGAANVVPPTPASAPSTSAPSFSVPSAPSAPEPGAFPPPTSAPEPATDPGDDFSAFIPRRGGVFGRPGSAATPSSVPSPTPPPAQTPGSPADESGDGDRFKSAFPAPVNSPSSVADAWRQAWGFAPAEPADSDEEEEN